MKSKIAAIVFFLMLALPQLGMAREASLDTVDVYIVPLEDFPEEAAAQLAKFMSEDMKLWVKGTLKMGTLDIPTLPGTNQLVSEDILEKSQKVLKRLPESSNKTYFLLLTTRDINSRSGGTRFQFSSHNRELKTSVVSLARMVNFVNGQPVVDNVAQTRLYKMMKRAIGEMRLGWKRSTNIEDIMYSPIMGIQDLDRVGIQHIETPAKSEVFDGKPKRLINAI